MLSGSLPPEWSSMSKLRQLYIFGTNLSGTLPSSWSNMTSMENLRLFSSPMLSGSLPPQWSSMSQLNTLYIYATNLSGTLPSSWSNMTNMSNLQLFSNPMLSGSLPPEWSSMSQVSVLYIYAASLSGTLPSSWSSMTRMLDIRLFSNPMLSGSLPSSWSAMTSVQLLILSSNAISGTLPQSWANMTQLTLLQISSNRLVGRVPASWLSIPLLQQLNLQNNCLSGPMPATTSPLLLLQNAINVCYTKVRGSGLNVSRCPGYQWPEYCNGVVSHTRSDSVTASATKSHLLSTTTSTSLSDTSLPQPTASMGTSSSVTMSSTVTQWVCYVTGGAVLVQLAPLVASVDSGGPVAYVVSANSNDVANRAGFVPFVRLATNSIPRATLITSGLWIAMNVSIATPGGGADRWAVGSVTLSGDALNWTAQSSNTVPWSLIVLKTPVGGWLDASVSMLADETLDFVVTMLCDGAEILEVSISVPAPGVPRVYAEEIATVGRSSQVASAVSTVSSGSALGRMMATRSMVLCDADSAVGGGVIDLTLEICGVSGESNVVARSAIVSNWVFVAVALSALLLLAALWAVITHTGLLEATAVLCMPASLSPALVAVVPSTASSATLLLARLGASECVALDVVLGIIGLALSMLPAVGFLHLWVVNANRWMTTAHASRAPPTLHPLMAMLKQILWRRWEWTTTEGTHARMERVWPVLLEYRELRYGALDNGVLFGLSIVSVVSGLTGSTAQCRGWSIFALLLLVAQLAAVIILQPMTTTFSQVYAISTVSLTCLGVLSQLLFVLTVESLWLVDAAAACSLAVLGLSLLTMTLNVVQLMAAVRRRIVMLPKVRSERAESLLLDRQSKPLIAVDLLLEDKSLEVDADDELRQSCDDDLDAVMLKAAAEESDNESHQLCDSGLFWNSDGAAVGTELVEGHSDIIRTDELLEQLMAQSYDRYSPTQM
ncbi:GP46-like surface antigen, putative [Bodo saltans]|uniref:GP46-like surface antigen, putative n=1 Tax=Bodo saltans TaxID=75058 RepID=A0A0S4J4P0_BODSA|nr:GP46-like surface antigen, putative [Bodo saltans]|eukprot:CUG77729.1 GP46-like surface antigen, putative [Bodo saltans]